MDNTILTDLSKEYAFKFNDDYTIDINYLDYMVDYSEKSYKLVYKEWSDSTETQTIYVPKSIVREDGSLPLWFVKENRRLPFRSYFDDGLEKVYSATKKVERFKERLAQAEGQEMIAKRTRNLERARAKLEEESNKYEQALADDLARFEV